MEYHCKMISASSLSVTPMGFISPLCDSCASRDCSNPIETKRMSILGVIKRVRLYCRGNEPKIVIDCEGYIPK